MTRIPLQLYFFWTKISAVAPGSCWSHFPIEVVTGPSGTTIAFTSHIFSSSPFSLLASFQPWSVPLCCFPAPDTFSHDQSLLLSIRCTCFASHFLLSPLQEYSDVPPISSDGYCSVVITAITQPLQGVRLTPTDVRVDDWLNQLSNNQRSVCVHININVTHLYKNKSWWMVHGVYFISLLSVEAGVRGWGWGRTVSTFILILLWTSQK